MTLHDRIDRARRNHGQVVHLQDMLVRDTCAQLQYEADLADDQGQDMHGLASTVERICERAASGPVGLRIVQADRDEIGKQINRLLLLQSALQS